MLEFFSLQARAVDRCEKTSAQVVVYHVISSYVSNAVQFSKIKNRTKRNLF